MVRRCDNARDDGGQAPGFGRVDAVVLHDLLEEREYGGRVGLGG